MKSPLIQTVHTSEAGDEAALEMQIDHALEAGARSLFLLGCDANKLDRVAVSNLLHDVPVPIFGGSFPAILTGDRLLEQGFVVAGLRESVRVHTIPELARFSEDDDDPIALPPEIAGAPGLLVLADGLSRSVDTLVTRLYDQIGPGRTVVGGGAGSLSFEQGPCIFSREGHLQDCLQVVGLPRPVEMTTRHGWQSLEGPFLVTDARGNEIRALNYRPAFDVYRETVERHTKLRFDDSTFFEIAKTFPFGLERLDDELLVRDPILVSGGALTCVGHVPENAMIYVLRGDAEGLIGAVGDAATGLGGSRREASDVFVFDCISRKLFLEDRFADELARIRAPFPSGSRLVGALTLGEIANSKSGAIEFHNKTAVVSVP